MKVKCVKFIRPGDENFLTIGKEYLVLELSVRPNESQYRVVSDFGTPILCSIENFTITNQNISKNWIAQSYSNYYFSMSPQRWEDDSLWRDSFWEDYFSDDDAKAKQVFEEEVAKMMKEDEENAR